MNCSLTRHPAWMTAVLLTLVAPVWSAVPNPEHWTVGDYAQYRIVEKLGEKSAEYTMWRLVEQVGEKGAVVVQIIQAGSQPVGQPPKLDTPGLRGGRLPLPAGRAPSFLPESKDLTGVAKDEPGEKLAIDKDRSFDCEHKSFAYAGKTGGQDVEMVVHRWVSESVPLGGLVKLEETFVKPQPGSRTTTLISFGKTAVTGPRQQLLTAAEATIRGDAAYAKDRQTMSLFLEQLVPATLNVGDRNSVVKILPQIQSNVPTSWIRLRAIQRAVELGDPDLARAICETEPMWADNSLSFVLGAYVDAGQLDKGVALYKALASRLKDDEAVKLQNGAGRLLEGLYKKGDLVTYRSLSRFNPPVIHYEIEVIKLTLAVIDPFMLQEAQKRIDMAIAAGGDAEAKASLSADALRGMKEAGVGAGDLQAKVKASLALWKDRTKEPPYWFRNSLTALAFAGEHKAVREQLDQLPEKATWYSTTLVEDLCKAGRVKDAIEYVEKPAKGYTPSSMALIAVAEAYTNARDVAQAKAWIKKALDAEAAEEIVAEKEREALKVKYGKDAWLHEKIRIGAKPWEIAAVLLSRLGQYEDVRQLYARMGPKHNDQMARQLYEAIYFAARDAKVEEVRKCIAAAPKARRHEFTMAAAAFLAANGEIDGAKSLRDQIETHLADRLILESILQDQVVRNDTTAAAVTLAELRKHPAFKDVPAQTLIPAALHCLRSGDATTAGEYLAAIKWVPSSSGHWIVIGSDGYQAGLIQTNLRFRPDLPQSAQYPMTLGNMLVEIGRLRGQQVKNVQTDGAALGPWLGKISNVAVRSLVMVGCAEGVPEK